MRKLIVLSAAALLVGAFAGGVQATPLSATGAIAMSGVAEPVHARSERDQGSVASAALWVESRLPLRVAPSPFVPVYELQGFPEFPG